MFIIQLATLACLTCAHQAASGSPVKPQAAFTETTRAFGNVAQGVVLSHTFVVRNEGTSALTIEGVDLQSPGMKTSFTGALPAGESSRITIEWNTAGSEGASEARAIVRLTDPARPRVELVLSATVTRSIDILPMPAVFFSVYKGDTATRSVTIVNRESRPLEITGVEAAGTHFEATVTPLEAGKSFRLDVTVPKDAGVGRFMEAVYLTTNHPALPRLKVGVNVLVKNDLYVNPEVLDLGTVSIASLTAKPELAELLTQKLIVRKRAGDFAIRSVSSSTPALEVTPASKERASAFEIVVSVRREQLTPGLMKGVIRIETDDKEFPVLEVPVAALVR